jgi:hypothetical protein
VDEAVARAARADLYGLEAMARRYGFTVPPR